MSSLVLILSSLVIYSIFYTLLKHITFLFEPYICNEISVFLVVGFHAVIFVNNLRNRINAKAML